jgi:arginyl-tRNA synthetase
MEEDAKVEKDISQIIKKTESGDPETLKMIKNAYTPVLEGIKESLRSINIEIDRYVPESKFIKDVKKVVEQLKKHAKEEDGAFYLDVEQGKFFFLRKDGTTLYATRDIAYHQWKAKRADLLINVLGEDHKLESKQVETGLKVLGIHLLPKPLFYAFVTLPEGKMSTRKGYAIYLDELIDECKKRALEEVKKRRSNLSEKKMKEIAEIVGIGALRYNIIKVQPEKDIVFKWEEALNFEGDAAPFIQYAHARACSILSKAEKKGSFTDLRDKSEIRLVKQLAKLPLIIEKASSNFKPHIVANYLYETAWKFNQFYRDCPVISEEEPIRSSRIALVDATRIVLRNGLDLLGIKAPKEM